MTAALLRWWTVPRLKSHSNPSSTGKWSTAKNKHEHSTKRGIQIASNDDDSYSYTIFQSVFDRNFKAGLDSSLGDIISAIASDFNKEFELTELENFYRQNLAELGSAKRATEDSIQKTQSNIVWMQKHYDEIVDWLERTNEEARNSDNKF